MPDLSMPEFSMPDRQRRYVGRRRAAASGRRHRAHREPTRGAPRIVLLMAAVAAVLVGTGAVARTLPFEPIILQTTAGSEAEPDRQAGAEPAEPPAEPATPADRPAADDPAAPEAPAPPPAPPEPAPAEPPASPGPPEPPASSPSPSPLTIVYEAEDAELSGFVRLFELDTASGGGVIGTIGLDVLNSVRFPAVTVDTAGTYELTFYYAGAPERQAMVTINDGEMITIDFPALDDARTIGSVAIEVELAAGPNAIWFGNPTGLAPALDRITVTG
ncbi:MAG TPA: hypothetical protein VIL37_15475 [Natronosporangium sp.]